MCAGVQAADVYAFGVLLWEMAAGQRMFAGMPWAQAMAAITLRHSRPRLPPGRAMPSGLDSVLRMCLLTSPADRPGFSEVCSKHGLARAPCICLPTRKLHSPPSTPLLESLAHTWQYAMPCWSIVTRLWRHPSHAGSCPQAHLHLSRPEGWHDRFMCSALQPLWPRSLARVAPTIMGSLQS